jgi:large subunit ribosomal protein L14e
MMEIGRVCIKTCGREKGKKCVVVDIIDKNFVMIDGNVKRRKCNTEHLELLPEKLEIKKGTSTAEVKELFKKHGLIELPKQPAVAHKRERKGKQEQGKKAQKPKKTEKEKKKAPVASSERQKRSSAETEEAIVEEALAASEV